MAITTHAADARQQLLQQLRGKPLAEKLATVLGARAQTVEDALEPFGSKFELETSAQAQLDMLGRIVGQRRNGMVDLLLRAWTKARIRINKASGTPEDLLDVLGIALPVFGTGAVERTLTEWFPAAQLIRLAQTITMSQTNARLLAEMVRTTRAGGVGTFLQWSPVPDTLTFCCADEYPYDTGPAPIAWGALDGGVVAGSYIFPMLAPAGDWTTDRYILVGAGTDAAEWLFMDGYSANTAYTFEPCLFDHGDGDDVLVFPQRGLVDTGPTYSALLGAEAPEGSTTLVLDADPSSLPTSGALVVDDEQVEFTDRDGAEVTLASPTTVWHGMMSLATLIGDYSHPGGRLAAIEEA